ncbi:MULTISPECIES: MBL fold metallo-hydrolase [Paenibacillus]|uniref:MBL fold metallo-hydrolase n=1 Tax=Paenibacillus albilobatus TaxID=2716884 RepID=A0A920CCG5_9BACL|nr:MULTISPECIES: MBL fold metallo-hydrolase [Paenibacillus]GIO31557.1 MBL fold metallo-hydrolase [Paenibacillus albilobatus]
MSQSQQLKKGQLLIQEIEDTVVPYGMVAVWPLGQASFIIKGGTTVIYIDPYVSHDPDRIYPAPIGPEHITNADYCLITHEHSDHLDLDAIAAMSRTGKDTIFMAPACCREDMEKQGVARERFIIADTEKECGEEVIIRPIPAAHEELETDEQGYHRYVGYLIKLNGVTVYHSGDTLVYEGLAERLRQESIDLGLLPINGRDAFRTSRGIIGNMDYREAAELAKTAGFGMTIPMHYDIFTGNTEHPGYFVDYVYDHFPEMRIHVIARGERFIHITDAALRAWG